MSIINNSAMWCPCKDCRNKKKYENSCMVHAHLIIRGFMDGYRFWIKHGEEGINEEIDLQGSHMDDRQSSRSSMHARTQGLSDRDIVEMGEQLGQMPDKIEEMLRDGMLDASDEKGVARLEALMRDAKLPLYPNCLEKYTKIFSCLKLLQVKAANHWTDWSFKQLLDVLRDLLPEGNHVSETTYETKQTICPFGLTVEKIDACKNECILFRGKDYEDKMECPVCGAPRYKHRKDGGDDFVNLKSTAEFKEQSEYFKALRERNIFDHHLGTCGYEGKFEEWEAEDERLAKEGITNPWAEYPEGRSRSFLRARSLLFVSEGKAEIIWAGVGTKEVAHKVKEKHTYCQDSGVKLCRENDILSACLGPEHTGRVRGFSCYKGWKHGFPESIEMHKKHRRVDYVALKAQLKAEIMDELMMVAVQEGKAGRCYIPSTGGGRMSSPCTPHDNDLVNTADLLDEPTTCTLLIHLGGTQIEVARGQMYPLQVDIHAQLLPGYAVLKVEYVHYPFRCHLLDPPPNVEITTLGQALMRRIQWRRTDILLNPEPMDSSTGNNSIRTQLEPALHVSMNKATSIGNEVAISKCGDQKQNKQKLGVASRRSCRIVNAKGELAVEPEQKKVDCEQQLHKQMDMQKDSQKEVACDKQMDKQFKVTKADRQKVGIAHQMDKQNKSQAHMRPHRNVLSKYATIAPLDRPAGKGEKKRGPCQQ